MTIDNGNAPDADEVMNAIGSNFKDSMEAIFNQDYNGFNAKLHNSGVPNLKNVFYSTLTADDAAFKYLMEYDATNDLYYTTNRSTPFPYVIIEADDATVAWSSNDCLMNEYAAGKWILWCTTGTEEVRRAKLYKSLFYGTTGSNQLILDFANVTALKTSFAGDVGFTAHYASNVATGNVEGTYTGTFSNTSTNTVNSWSYCNSTSATGTFSRWEMPSATTLNSAVDTTSDETETDTSGDEATNPATCQLDNDSIAGQSSTTRVFMLSKGTISWVHGGAATTVVSNIDFAVDNSIPAFTSAAALSSPYIIFADTAPETVTNAIASMNVDINGSSSVQRAISAKGGSAWTNVDDAKIARPTSGTALWRRTIFTTAAVSTADKITEEAVKYNFY